MKVLICAKLDLLASIAVNQLLPHLHDHDVSIVLSDVFSRRERASEESRISRFFEHDMLVDIIFPLLEKLPCDLDSHTGFYSFDQIQNTYGVPVISLTDINNAESIDYVSDILPDVIFSCRYDYIFKEPVLSIPKYGIVNTHSGKLPTYRGVNAPLQSIINGESNVACTLHYVDQGIDTGDIIEICYAPVDITRSLLWHGVAIYKLGVQSFLRWLNTIERSGCVETTSQDHREGYYYSFPDRSEFSALCEKGVSPVSYSDYLEIVSYYVDSVYPATQAIKSLDPY